MKLKFFFRNVHLLAEKNNLKIFDKIQSVNLNFPAVNNISKFHENQRQKISSGLGGLKKKTTIKKCANVGRENCAKSSKPNPRKIKTIQLSHGVNGLTGIHKNTTPAHPVG